MLEADPAALKVPEPARCRFLSAEPGVTQSATTGCGPSQKERGREEGDKGWEEQCLTLVLNFLFSFVLGPHPAVIRGYVTPGSFELRNRPEKRKKKERSKKKKLLFAGWGCVWGGEAHGMPEIGPGPSWVSCLQAKRPYHLGYLFSPLVLNFSVQFHSRIQHTFAEL